MTPQLRLIDLQRPDRRRCIVSHGGLTYGLVRWSLVVPLNQIEATASKCAKETLRHLWSRRAPGRTAAKLLKTYPLWFRPELPPGQTRSARIDQLTGAGLSVWGESGAAR